MSLLAWLVAGGWLARERGGGEPHGWRRKTTYEFLHGPLPLNYSNASKKEGCFHSRFVGQGTPPLSVFMLCTPFSHHDINSQDKTKSGSSVSWPTVFSTITKALVAHLRNVGHVEVKNGPD